MKDSVRRGPRASPFVWRPSGRRYPYGPMQRIRIGLTGLGLVLVIVFASAAGMRPTHSFAPLNAAGETLSSLGVAPAQGEAHIVKAPTPPRTRTP